MAWIGTAGLFASLPMLLMSHARRDSIASPAWLAAAAVVLIAATVMLLGLVLG